MTHTTQNEEKLDAIYKATIELYLAQPFWKRWASERAILSNGWDYTHLFNKCWEIADIIYSNIQSKYEKTTRNREKDL